ncbi:helix-turn-helix transcriptional regulator [Kitasatospora sp. GAS204B]|uniref:helix-turn-helix domain-containing protein n=1 Tax=unclassified Kitasatospora TaxID=2633591 RepID=UPI0024767366|nr:helix-turn-helix transcriptional regulator [Kitasatospora sp. GAS204B]MDH6122086.1 transcriptional regulator with XRE-family HTH domain [Kitasatospora sp. GAS204B]
MAFQPRPLFPERSARDLYGADLRRYREAAGMSLSQLGEVLKFSKAHLSRIETAESLPPEGLSEKLDAAFGTDGHFTRLYPLAILEQFPDRYKRYMELAAQAVVRESFTEIVPGLLQTPDYAEAIMRSGDPFATDEEIEQKVAARLKQQERLRSANPPRYWFILDEVALRRPVGGPIAMRDQMQRLLDAARPPHLTIQVLPFSAGAHSEMGGSLVLLTLPGGHVVAYEEGSRTGSLIEKSEDVAKRRAYYDHLRALALSPEDSLATIGATLRGFDHAARPVAEE